MKTAVEKLFELIDEIPIYSPEASDLYLDIIKLKDQAKEIEKEQIIEAYWNGTIDLEKNEALKIAEQYYNETFKSE